MTLDIKEQFKQLYTAPEKTPIFVDVPEQKIISIAGTGDPYTTAEFKNAIEALFEVAHRVMFACKKLGENFSVMPLEGLWWTEGMKPLSALNKDIWEWELFIVQPDFVTKEIFDGAVSETAAASNPSALSTIEFKTINEGRSVQVMRIGHFNNEALAVTAIDDFISDNGCRPNGKHHEIYLSDARKVAPEKQETIIRQPVV